jgi:hypothetical protein
MLIGEDIEIDKFAVKYQYLQLLNIRIKKAMAKLRLENLIKTI